MSKITEIRAQIGDLQAEIERLRLGFLTRSEAAERLKGWVDSQAERVHWDAIVHSASQATQRINKDPMRAFVGADPDSGGGVVDMSALMCFLGGDALKQRFEDRIYEMDDELFSNLDPAERTQALNEKQDQLDRLEREEESLIVKAEKSGQMIPRRRDVRPEIVLAPEET